MESLVEIHKQERFSDIRLVGSTNAGQLRNPWLSKALSIVTLAAGLVGSDAELKAVIRADPSAGEVKINQDSGYPNPEITNGNDPIAASYIHTMGVNQSCPLKLLSVDGAGNISRVLLVGTTLGSSAPSVGAPFKVVVYSSKAAIKNPYVQGDVGTFPFVVKEIQPYGKTSATWDSSPTFIVEVVPDLSKPAPKIPSAGAYYFGCYNDEGDSQWSQMESNIPGVSDLFVTSVRPGVIYTVKELSGQIGTYKSGNMAVDIYVKYDATTPTNSTPPTILSQVSINIAQDDTGTNVVIGSTANTIAAAEQFAATNPASAADLTNYVAVLESQLLGPGGLGTNWVVKTAELGTIPADKFLSGEQKFTTPKKVNPPEFYRVGFKRKE